MRIISHGIDIVEFVRIEKIWRDHGGRFLERVYTPAERRYCLEYLEPVTRLSGRFAAKEAVLKALGTGWRGGIEWTDIETLADSFGKPVCTLRGRSAEIAARLGIVAVLVSISHTGEYALASAIGCAPD
jgi:holo-[acyl-carrier protein] synthase